MQANPVVEGPDFNKVIDQLGVGEWKEEAGGGSSHYYRKYVECGSYSNQRLVSKMFHTILREGNQPKCPEFDRVFINNPFYNIDDAIARRTVAEFGCQKTGPAPVGYYDEDLGAFTVTPPIPPPTIPAQFLSDLKTGLNTYLINLTQNWEPGDKEALKKTVLTNDYHFGKLYNDPEAQVWQNRSIVHDQFAEDNLRTFAVIGNLYNSNIRKQDVEFLTNDRERCLYMMGTPSNVQQLFRTIDSHKINPVT